MPGAPGTPGQDGERGERGLQGPQGEQGPSGLNGGGLTYTRWGRTTCPTQAGTSLIYDGLSVGGHDNFPGGGSNRLCLVKNDSAEYHPGTTEGQSYGSHVYGIAYQLGAFRRNLGQHRYMPCAACHVSTRSAQIMIPGTYKCPSGWTPEYSGWLMAGQLLSRGRSMHTCVDRDAEVVKDLVTEQEASTLYHVRTNCITGIPCPTYSERKELACVVCTK